MNKTTNNNFNADDLHQLATSFNEYIQEEIDKEVFEEYLEIKDKCMNEAIVGKFKYDHQIEIEDNVRMLLEDDKFFVKKDVNGCLCIVVW